MVKNAYVHIIYTYEIIIQTQHGICEYIQQHLTKHNMNNTSDGQHLKNSNTQQNNITTTQMTTQRTITLANLHKTLNEESHQSKYDTDSIMHTHEQ